MRIYRVGGSVRDELLGRPVKDRDWVVVGGTPERMVELGYRPVGRDFPVFLHPGTHEEYALARTERKVSRGYRGFVVHCAPEVTLEEDLQRRDLTINAMARDETGALIDPHGGAADLAAGCLRHVSEAFVEDPVRILRLARFAARFPDFRVATETMDLMRAMVGAGEVDALVAERVWQELSTGLMEEAPTRMFEVLIDSGALARLLPELSRDWALVPRGRLLDVCSQTGLELPERYASVVLTVGDHAPDTLLDAHCSDRLKVPAACREFARLGTRLWPALRDWRKLDACARMTTFETCDALRRPDRALALARWAQAIGPILEPARRPSIARVFEANLSAAQGVNAGAIARSVNTASAEAAQSGRAESSAEVAPHGGNDSIARAIREARIQALKAGTIEEDGPPPREGEGAPTHAPGVPS
jgi:tRNA nucleotidyltransferase (CCA-adding enzyme)